MGLVRALAELHKELKDLDRSISALERLISGQQPRRGRPPKWLAAMRGKHADKGMPTAKNSADKEDVREKRI